MRNQAYVVLALAASCLLSGCMTGYSVCYFTPEEGGKKVFGGVRLHCQVMQEAMAEGEEKDQWGRLLPRLLLFTLDMPLSAVGDVLTLPYTVPYALVHGDDLPLSRQYSDRMARPIVDGAASEAIPPTPILPGERDMGGRVNDEHRMHRDSRGGQRSDSSSPVERGGSDPP